MMEAAYRGADRRKMLGAFGEAVKHGEVGRYEEEKRENRGGKKSKDRVAWPRDRNPRADKGARPPTKTGEIHRF